MIRYKRFVEPVVVFYTYDLYIIYILIWLKSESITEVKDMSRKLLQVWINA